MHIRHGLTQINKMEHKEFLKRYIKPFYMDLMKMNFISKEEEYTKDMFKKLKSISKELTDQEIYNHKNLENIYSSSWWQDFTIHLKERRDSDIIMKLIESNYYYETIKETIRRINN